LLFENKKEIDMLGKTLIIKGKKVTVVLKPFTVEELTSAGVLNKLADYMVTRHTRMQAAPTAKNEIDFFEKVSSSRDSVNWGIYKKDPNGELSELLGTTNIDIKDHNHMGGTGFVLWDKAQWRKGIASTAHIGRTLYAANHLGLKTIVTSAMLPNIGSIKALQSVGYFITGYKLADDLREGQYLHHVNLQWINPIYEDILTQDLPEQLREVAKEGIAKAKATLELAKEVVSYG
jgi:RimJ/RimL family protein N-acetyltransferase